MGGGVPPVSQPVLARAVTPAAPKSAPEPKAKAGIAEGAPVSEAAPVPKDDKSAGPATSPGDQNTFPASDLISRDTGTGSSVGPWYLHLENGHAYNPGDGHYYYTAGARRMAAATGADGGNAFDATFGKWSAPTFSRNNGTAENDGLGPLRLIPGPVGRGVAIAESLGDCADGKGCLGVALSLAPTPKGKDLVRLTPILALAPILASDFLNDYSASATGGGTRGPFTPSFDTEEPTPFDTEERTWPGFDTEEPTWPGEPAWPRLALAPYGLPEHELGGHYLGQVRKILEAIPADKRASVLQRLMEQDVPAAMAGHNYIWQAIPVPGQQGLYYGIKKTPTGVVRAFGVQGGVIHSGEATLEDLMTHGAAALLRRRR